MDDPYRKWARIIAYFDAIYLRRDIFHGEINVASAMEQSTQRNRQKKQYLFE